MKIKVILSLVAVLFCFAAVPNAWADRDPLGDGLWINRDPLTPSGPSQDDEMHLGVNLYDYVSNDPINLTDPLGLFPQKDVPPGMNQSGEGEQHHGWSEHTNFLSFTIKCPKCQQVDKVVLIYDLYMTGPTTLTGAGPGGIRDVIGVNCDGNPVTVLAYMRTRYTNPLYDGPDAFLNRLDYGRNTRVFWTCKPCKK